jgi:hypothetical protein
MEIILSKQCESLTGTLGRCYGYAIQRRTDLDGRTRFWGVRKSTGAVPADGHLNFIFTCAELAQAKLHIADIRVSAKEVREAFNEAGPFYGDRLVKAPAKKIYNAREVLDFKKWC